MAGVKSNVPQDNNTAETSPTGTTTPTIKVVTRKTLQELARQVDPNEQLDEDVEDLLLSYADEFMESIMEGSCVLAAHRKASAVDVKDVHTHLERSYNIWVPGFGTEELKPYKRAPVTEAHKQRMALIKKTIKKY